MNDEPRQHSESNGMNFPAVRREITRPTKANLREVPPGRFYAPTGNLCWIRAWPFDANPFLYQLWRSPYRAEPELWVKVPMETL